MQRTTIMLSRSGSMMFGGRSCKPSVISGISKHAIPLSRVKFQWFRVTHLTTPVPAHPIPSETPSSQPSSTSNIPTHQPSTSINPINPHPQLVTAPAAQHALEDLFSHRKAAHHLEISRASDGEPSDAPTAGPAKWKRFGDDDGESDGEFQKKGKLLES